MELVYLWVEDYKNIHCQGFNFSPRFRCNYNPETNELKIEENKDYIPNFFGENINITAIVGKNGSGKSSVLEALHFILNDKDNAEFKYILVYKMDDDNDEPSYISNIEITTIATEIDIKNTECHIYTNDFIKYKNSIDIQEESILNYLVRSSLESNFKLTSFMYIPDILEITAVIDKVYSKVLDDMIDKIYSIYDDKVPDGYNDERAKIIKDILYNLKSSIESDYHKYLLILYLNEYKYDDLNNLDDIDDLINKLKESEIEYLEEDEFNKYFSAVNEKKDISELDKEEKDIYLRYPYFFEFDFIDNKSRRYNDLSHGERTIFGQFLSIYSISRHSPYTNSFVYLLDEAELSLHPNWQKQYIHEIVCLLKKIEKKFNIIFATHSPFLLSDILKQNIIFLDTDKEGNCKVVDGLKEKKQTFGANIHTLLSDSFFMEDGLMGEFAKGKIENIRKFYNKVIKYKNNEKVKKAYRCFYEKKQKEFWDIQSIIGEPFLQTIVKNQLEEIEFILFEEKAQEIHIKRYIEEFGADKIREFLDGQV